MAVNIPIGTPINNDPNVTTKEHEIKGKIPNKCFAGAHSVPVKNFKKPISDIAGIPDEIR